MHDELGDQLNTKPIVLVLPGSEAQISLIQYIQKRGFDVVCINPYENSPAFSYSKYSEKGNILDKEHCEKIARKYNVAAVISDECDIAMPTVATLGHKLKLHTLTIEDSQLYTNKYLMRKECERLGIPIPQYRKCSKVEDAISFWNENHWAKMIIKPIDSNSSRGVYIIESIAHLKEYFEKTISFSKCDQAILCEEYIEGQEYSVDGIKTETAHVSLIISEKEHYHYNKNIANQLFFSHYNERVDYNQLKAINDYYVEKSGLKFGFTHAEYKYSNGTFYMIEIGARGGGNFISSHIVPIMTGVDNYAILLNLSLGNTYELKYSVDAVHQNRCAVLHFFDVEKPGTVVTVTNKEILDDERVLKYAFNFSIGDKIKKAENDSARAGYYIAYGESKNELLQFMEHIKEKIKIVVR